MNCLLTNNQPSLFDSHCHLDFPDFNHDRGKLLKQCGSSGIRSLCIPSTQFTNWHDVINVVGRQNQEGPEIYYGLGLHPFFITHHCSSHLEALENHLHRKSHHLVAVGEIGLDYNTQDLRDKREKQELYFDRQLDLANKHRLPVIIHARKSHDAILKILRKHMLEKAGIIHAFSGSEQQAKQYIDMGFKLGFGGVLTYERAKKTRKLASILPLTSIVLETDAPDMPLSGHQGERNSPLYLPKILSSLASLRHESKAEIACQTTQNTEAIFGISHLGGVLN